MLRFARAALAALSLSLFAGSGAVLAAEPAANDTTVIRIDQCVPIQPAGYPEPGELCQDGHVVSHTTVVPTGTTVTLVNSHGESVFTMGGETVAFSKGAGQRIYVVSERTQVTYESRRVHFLNELGEDCAVVERYQWSNGDLHVLQNDVECATTSG